MTTKARSIRLALLLTLVCSWAGSCRGLASLDQKEITEIQSPADLSDQLKQVKIHLFQRGEFGTRSAVLDLGNTNQQIYHSPEFLSGVDLSPDGTQLVYARLTAVDSITPIWIYRVDLDTGNEIKVAGWDENYDQISVSNPSFTADGQSVLFAVTWYKTGKIGLARVSQSGDGLEILDTNLTLNDGPEASPDYSFIMVTCSGSDQLSGNPGFQLCLLDSQGKYLKQLTQSGLLHGSYFFMPGGDQIIYTEEGEGGIIPKSQVSLIIQDLHSGVQKKILDWEVDILGFSPDGNEIIFQGKRNRWAAWAIYLMRSDGTDLRHLAYFDGFLEDWYAQVDQE